MNKSDKIFIAGASGMAGSAIIRNLVKKGYSNLIVSYHSKTLPEQKDLPLKQVQINLQHQEAVNQFFKQTFSIRENAVDFVKHTLPPELADGIDFSTLALEKGSHVDTALAEHFSDTVYTCQLSGIKIKIALLFEHKSSPDNNLLFQLHRYMGNLWENSIKQKQARMPVIPVVLYHGKIAWSPGTLISRFKNLPDAVKPFIQT